MYRLVAISAVLLTTSSSTILDNLNYLDTTYDIKAAQEKYEKYLETLPDSLKEDAHLLVVNFLLIRCKRKSYNTFILL